MPQPVSNGSCTETGGENGYDVEQNPSFPGGKNPDYRIEGKIFDSYAPATGNIRNIADVVKEKVVDEQTRRIVLNLDDTRASLEALKQQFAQYPVENLEEVIGIRNGIISHIFP